MSRTLTASVRWADGYGNQHPTRHLWAAAAEPAPWRQAAGTPLTWTGTGASAGVVETQAMVGPPGRSIPNR
jgi:hypothetical protein